MPHLTRTQLKKLGTNAMRDLTTELGVLASAKHELYGCLFGRDSLITVMKLMRAHRKQPDPFTLDLTKRTLRTLATLQGTATNVESGEEPGKIIHEYRPDRHEHLTRDATPPWYLYPGNVLKNYDSVDSTPLFIIALWRYYDITGDREFVTELLPSVHAAVRWILEYADSNGDGLIDYRIPPGRTCGGLVAQSWMDSREALFHESGAEVAYPIAPVEVQAYAYAALRISAERLVAWGEETSELHEQAAALKRRFNELFITGTGRRFGLAAAIDGNLMPLHAARSSMGHVLWAALESEEGIDSVLEAEYLPTLVRRLMRRDLFEPQAGIRTLSKQSSRFLSKSYHNGSVWPHDSGMIAEGLERCGYLKEAARVRRALARAYRSVKTPIELVCVIDGKAAAGETEAGQKACTMQAWSAATLVAEL